jgi:hypothetical protein
MAKIVPIKPSKPTVADPVPEWAQAMHAKLASMHEDLREIKTHLALRKVSPDDADTKVATAIAALDLQHPQTAHDLFAFAVTDLQLKQALDAALIDDPKQLGKLLTRLRKRGLAVRGPRGSQGWHWSV